METLESLALDPSPDFYELMPAACHACRGLKRFFENNTPEKAAIVAGECDGPVPVLDGTYNSCGIYYTADPPASMMDVVETHRMYPTQGSGI